MFSKRGLKCMKSKKNQNISMNRVKHALGITGALVFLICSLAVAVIVNAGIQMYTAYTTAELQKQAVKYATDNGYYLDINFNDKSAIGFNVKKGTAPSSIKGSSDTSTRVTVRPKDGKMEYYRYPDGSIVYPY